MDWEGIDSALEKIINRLQFPFPYAGAITPPSLQGGFFCSKLTPIIYMCSYKY